MIRQNKKHTKKGFTLIELMLALAIMFITFESIFSLIISTYNTHREVSYMNCCTELLEINSTALETHMLNFLGSAESSVSYSCSGAAVVTSSGPLVNIESIKDQNGNAKFHIGLEFSSSGETVDYVVTVYDNATGGKYGSISKSVWLPHCSNGGVSVAASGDTLTLTK